MIIGNAAPTNWLKRWISIGLAWLCWSIMSAALQRAASQLAFEYNINAAVLWHIFGQPDDIYSFRNLAIPRLIEFVATTVPAALMGLAVYQASRSSRWRFTISSIVIILGASIGFAVIGAGAGGSTNTEMPTPGLSLLFLLFLVCVTALAGYLLEKTDSAM